MILSLFRRAMVERGAEPVVVATIMSRIEPLDRGEVYEDPLDEMLRGNGLGQVTGGGSELSENGEICHVDIEIALKDTGDEIIARIIHALEELGAPKGSYLTLLDNAARFAFGRNEGLGLYLNGTDLAAEVYEQTSLEDVEAGCGAALEGIGRHQGSRSMATETAAYFYGPSYEEMKTAILPFVATYPLCEKARIEQVA